MGVVGEMLGDAGIFETSGRLEAIRKADNLKLQVVAGEARDRAAKSELALEQFRAPRTLTADQQQDLYTRITPFAGTRVRVWLLTGGGDISGLGDVLSHVLTESHWDVGRASSMSGKTAPGVLIAIRKGSSVGPQAEILVTYLNSVGILAMTVNPFDGKDGLMPAANMSALKTGEPDMVIAIGSKQ